VTRALDRAAENGWVLRQQIFVREKVPAKLFLKMIRALGMAPGLLHGLRSQQLGEVHVVPGTTLERFGREAAVFVARRLRGCANVGVAWGGELASVVTGLNGMRVLRPGSAGIDIFPLRGDPIGFLPARDRSLLERSPSALAEMLHRVLNPRGNFVNSLSGVPAMVPPLGQGDEEKFRVLEEILGEIPAYARVVGKKQGGRGAWKRAKPLLETADMILTSVGPAQAVSPWTQRCFASDPHLRRRKPEDMIAGDIAGVLLPNARGSGAAFRALQRRWLGVNRDHLKECVRRAEGKNSGGVVICALNPAKADAILQAIEAGLCSCLIVGSELALAICRTMR
jgi:hypothetical protein